LGYFRRVRSLKELKSKLKNKKSNLENDNELENLLRQRLNQTDEDEIKEEYIEAE